MGSSRTTVSLSLLILLALSGIAAGGTADPGPPCELQWLDPYEDSGSRFPNYACRMDGDWLYLGDADPEYGAVHIYRRQGLTWVYDELLLPDEPIADIAFGYRLAVDGDRLLVGAPLYNSVDYQPGAVYAFRRTGGNWVQEEIIVPGDEPWPDRRYLPSRLSYRGGHTLQLEYRGRYPGRLEVVWPIGKPL